MCAPPQKKWVVKKNYEIKIFNFYHLFQKFRRIY